MTTNAATRNLSDKVNTMANEIAKLDALGRNAEAAQVRREAILSWPRMTFARRTFRFLGKVANEAKGLLVGVTSKGQRDPNKKMG